jgi:PST family polysaccharide transporter
VNIATIARNSAWIGLVQILNLALPILTVPVVSRAFGPGTYGLITSLSAVAGYAGLIITFGFHLTGPRAIARTSPEPAHLSEVFSTIYLAQIMLAGLAVVAILALLPFFGFGARASFVGAVLIASVVFSSLTPIWMFIGLQSMGEIALSQFFIRIVGAALIFVFVRQEGDVLLYVTINASVALLGCVCSLIILRRRGIKLRRVAYADVLNTIRSAGRLFLSSVAMNLYTATNIVVVELLLGPVAAGYFGLADRVRGAAVGVFEPVSQALYPYLCGPNGSGEGMHSDNVRAENRRTFFRAMIALSLLASVLLYFASPLVADFLGGERFAKSVPLLKILSVTPLVICLSSLLSFQTMLPANQERELARIVVTAGLCGVPLIVLAIKVAGLEGAAWSYVILEAGILVAMAVTVSRRQSIKALLFRPSTGASDPKVA